MALAFLRPVAARGPALPGGGVYAFVATALVYALTGWAGSLLAIPGCIASPLYPAAGVALASVLVFGPRMLPAIALGSLGAGLISLPQAGLPLATALGLAVVFAIGAVLQALLGAVLVQRTSSGPLTLAEPRQIGLFFAAALIASVVSAGTARFGFELTGAVAAPLCRWRRRRGGSVIWPACSSRHQLR